MNSELLFLLRRSWKNRILSRLRRLRNPRYLVSALAGIGYLYFVFIHQAFVRGSRIPHTGFSSDHGSFVLVEIAFSGMLMGFALFHLVFSNARTPVFNEAEVQFLFPAPLPRRTLMDYRLAKAQTGIIFGSFISLLILERGGLFPNPFFLLITIWAVYSLLYLYRMAVLLAKQALMFRGIGDGRIRKWAAAAILLAAVFAGVWGRRRHYPVPLLGREWNYESLLAWLQIVTESGPVHYALYPFRVLVRPAFSGSIADFVLRIAPVIAALLAFYAGLRQSNAAFEASAAGPSAADGVPGIASKKKHLRKPRRSPFRLEPDGLPFLAIYWKNLSLAGGLRVRKILPVFAVLTFSLALLSRTTGEGIAIIVGATSLGAVGFLTIMGPVVFRGDLRTDLRNIDLLKTYPVPGWGIVLGEVLGPSTILAFIQWALILFAASTLPGLGNHPWALPKRIYAALGAVFVLPCLGVIGVLVQNAAVLLLPGWFHLGKEHQRGVEAMGQRLISSVATVLFVVIAAIPAGILFLASWAAGQWLIGIAVIPFAALAASAGLLLEAALIIVWLGRLFDRLDPSTLNFES